MNGRPKITKENFKEFLGEESSKLTEEDRKAVANFLKKIPGIGAAIGAASSLSAIKKVFKKMKKEKKPKKELEKAEGGIVKRYKGGLMVKPKAAKRGY